MTHVHYPSVAAANIDIRKRNLIDHLRAYHNHIDSATEMAKWDRDELERAHISAHRLEEHQRMALENMKRAAEEQDTR